MANPVMMKIGSLCIVGLIHPQQLYKDIYIYIYIFISVFCVG